MRIRPRLILLLSSVILIFLVIFVVFRNSEKSALVLLFQKETEDKKIAFDKLVQLKGKSTETLSIDYTYWGEMVDFIKTADPAWAKNNIDTCLSTYSVNVIWIYRLDFSLVYSTNNLEEASFKELPLPKEILKQLFPGEKRLAHFFLNTQRGLMEIRGATVHPSSDAERKTPPQGYFFTGRLWDEGYVSELAELTNSKIELMPILGKEGFNDSFIPQSGVIAFSRILTAWDESPLTRLHVQTISEAIKKFNLLSKNYFLVLLIIAGITIAVFVIFVIRWIGIPLHLISRTLNTDNLKYISSLQKNKTEFGDISRLIDKFFEQREELRASRESFHNIVERSEEGIVVADMQGTVRFINAAGQSLLGRNDLLGKPFIFPVAEGEVREAEIIRSSGKKGLGEIRAVKTEWERKPGYLISIIDITERKEIERNQRLAQLGKIVADMAHEVNNPLMVISGNAQLSLMGQIANEEIKKNLEIMFEESQKAKNIMQRLLKFSRPSRGQFKDTDINKSLDEVTALLEHQFKLYNIEIKRNYVKGPPILLLDEKQMEEVFINILNNARDAMPKGGLIEITTACKMNFLRIDFKDTGCGIPDEVMKNIFEPFFTTKEKGTGLGLPICNSIVKAHNGELKVESALGKGTTVSILLPLKEGKENV